MITKRGAIFQIMFLMIIIFITAIVGLLFYTLSFEITKTYDQSGIFDNTPIAKEKNLYMQSVARYTTDETVLFLFIAMIIALIIAAAKTKFSPLVIFLFILVLLIAILNASGMVNIYQGLATSPVLSETSGHLTFTNIIFGKYLPLIICVLGALIMIIMYSKSGGDIIQ